MTEIYRAEVVGSMLRPKELLTAQQEFRTGQTTAAQLKRIEDRAVDGALAIQHASGVDVVTDGEMRRMIFTGPLTETVDGIQIGPPESTPAMQWHGGDGLGDLEFRPGVSIVGRLRRKRSLATEEYVYLRGRRERPIKATLPSPLMLSVFWTPGISDQVYADAFEAFADGAAIVREEAEELAALGCEYIQIDAPELATHAISEEQRAIWASRGVDPDRLTAEGVDLVNTIADVPGVKFTLHLCRGNNAGRWMGAGGYDAIAKEVFKRATNFDAFSLEYDDERSGGFEPLRDVPDDKVVVLGLVSSKHDELESHAELVARIDEASRYFPRNQLALSTQCGFASSAPGNPIQWETQERKLRLVAEVAHDVW